MKSLAIICVLAFLCAGASATTYYVDPSGFNGNDGLSPQTPWRTLLKERRAVSADAVAHAAQSGHFYVSTGRCDSVQARWGVERVAYAPFEWNGWKFDQV